MIRAVLRDGLFYGLSSIISRGLSVLVLPFYTRVLSPADYGALDMLSTVGALANLTVALEISQAVARYYPDSVSSTDKRRLSSTAFWFTFAMYGLFLIVTLSFSSVLNKFILGDFSFLKLFRLGLVWIVFDGLFYLIQNQFRWEFKSRQYAAISLLYSLATVGCGVGFAFVLRLGVAGVIAGQLVAAVLASCCGCWLLRNSLGWEFDWHKLGEMLNFSSPLVPAGVAVFISLYINRLALNSLTTLHEVGLFGMGIRLASMAGLLIVGIQGALTPLIYLHHREPGTPLQISKLFSWFVAIALVGCLALGLFANTILKLFTTPAYYEAAPTVILLAPAFLLSQMYIFTPGIAVAKKTHWQLWITVCSSLVSAGLNWGLIPLFSVAGAAWATLIAAFLHFFAWILASQRLYPIPFQWRPIILSTFLAVAVAMVGYLCTASFQLNMLSELGVKLGLLAVSVAGIFLFRLIRWGDLKYAFFLAIGKLSNLHQR